MKWKQASSLAVKFLECVQNEDLYLCFVLVYDVKITLLSLSWYLTDNESFLKVLCYQESLQNKPFLSMINGIEDHLLFPSEWSK